MNRPAGSLVDDKTETPLAGIAIPRHAASLIVVDMASGVPRFLMGCRNKAHRFMPSVYVFPGGGVEAGDEALGSRTDMAEPVLSRLSLHTGLTGHRLAALPLAAIRETFEETGFVVGTVGKLEQAPRNWRAFADFGYRPAHEHLVPVGRAITPPQYPTRYDARFFAVPRAMLIDAAGAPPDSSNELENIGWFSMGELGDLPLAQITRRILSDVADRLQAATLFDPRHRMPFYRHENGVSKRDLI